MEIVAQRTFNLAYICLDIAFLLVFCGMLLFTKRRLTLIWALFGGVLYFVVDYGIFHLLTHSRSISGGSMFWVLLWMSMSYGITNFAWIWLALKKDPHFAEWTILIFTWWLACPMLASMFKNAPLITIARTTGKYHGVMGAFLFVSYLAVVIYNLRKSDKKDKFNILWLFVIGVAVQFGWEFSLLIGGIRSSLFTDGFYKLKVLITNSLVETNLGLPAIYCIYLFTTSRINEDLTKRNKITFTERLRENNLERYSKKKEKTEEECA